jgi:hypothetical protein
VSTVMMCPRSPRPPCSATSEVLFLSGKLEEDRPVHSRLDVMKLLFCADTAAWSRGAFHDEPGENGQWGWSLEMPRRP